MNDDTKAYNEYKHILSTASRLENIQSNLDSVIDFFNSPILNLCTKLCNGCLKLLFGDEFKLEQFRKVEELTWRRVYHDIYRVHKTKRQPLREQDEWIIGSHFMSGIGFYSGLIVRLRTHYHIHDVAHVIRPLNLPIGPIDNLAKNEPLNFDDHASNDTNSTSNRLQGAAQNWARNAIYRSLIYIGDLSRYMLETNNHDFRKLAFMFYQSASRFQPEFGLPFNQLATLAGGTNHNLDAVCSYMRCVLRKKVFEGAEGNMRKVFELNDRYFLEIISNQPVILRAPEILASKDPVHDAELLMKKLIIIFIRLTSGLWSAISGRYDDDIQRNIVEDTRLFFELLREAIDLDPIMPLSSLNESDTSFMPLPGYAGRLSRPRFLTPTIMYEFSCVAIMLIAKCQREQHQPISNNLVELTNTLALNLLHYATTKCQKMIIRKLRDLRMSDPDEPIVAPSSEFNLVDISGNLSNSSQRSLDNINSSSDTSRKNLSRLRRKQAASNYSDGGSRLLSNNDPDLSELEETALSTIDALDISSEISEGEDFRDLIDLDSSSSDIYRLSRHPIRTTQSQSYETRKPCNPLDDSTSSLPGYDLLTGDLEFYNANLKFAPTSTKPGPTRDKTADIVVTADDNSAFAYLYLHTYLPTVKVLFDWLLSNVTVINTNLDSFKSFNTELAKTAQLLDEILRLVDPKDNRYGKHDPHSNQSLSVYNHRYNNPDWIQLFPLSCDYPLINLSPLKNVHDINIDFDCLQNLTDAEAGFVTSQCIFAFSHALSSFLRKRNC